MINIKNSKKFIIPVLIEFSWIIVLLIKTNVYTVWLFALNGLVHGITQCNLMTPLQETLEDELQTGAMSLASTGARLLYIPLIYFVNYLGNIKFEYGLAGVLGAFLPMCLIAYIKLLKMEKYEKCTEN